MRPESVGLMEVRSRDSAAEVTQVGVTFLQDNPASLEGRPHAHDNGQSIQGRGSDIFSNFWSAMATWGADKLKSATTSEYLAVSEDAGDGEDGANGDSIRSAKHKPRIHWSWTTCFFGLIMVTVTFLVVSAAEAMAHRYLGVHRARSDPFANWGKQGSGTEELAWYPTDFLRDVLPIACHSHNDYWRNIPLFTALYAGCTGVESDVWLRDGDLLVGHDTASLQPNRTFESLYVNPLYNLLNRQNPSTEYYNGKYNGVFDTDPGQTLVLLVDIKTDGAETWPWVMKQLAPLREKGWLSYYENDQFHQRPITVVGTGNAPFDQIIGNSSRREAFFDAPLDKLENSGFNSTNSYYASADFWKAIGGVWWSQGPSKGQLEKIRSHLREAKDRGLVSRYWGLPWWPIHVRNQVWKVLVDEGIGMLNVDDLEAASKGDWTKSGKSD